MKHRYLIFIIILVLIVCFFFFKSVNNSNQTTHTIKQPAPLPAKEVTIKLDKSGFSPKEIIIKTGTAVIWKNASGNKQTVNSDNYPTNQLYKELNFGVFPSGASFSYIFTKSGTYGYHNQFHHDQNGKIIVTK